MLNFSVECPNCNKEFKIDFLKLKSGDTVKCPHCEKDIEIIGDIEELRKVYKSIKLLDKTLNKKF